MTEGRTQPILDSWSRGNAICAVAAALVSLGLERPWPIAVGGALSFAVLFALARASGLAFGIADLMTAARLALTLAIPLAFHGATGRLVGGMVFTVFVLDGLDGWLARRSGTASEFGAHFDMETDALLVLVASFELWYQGRLGAWALIPGFLRYGYVLCMMLVPGRGGDLPRSRLGRYAFFVLMLGLSAGLALPNALGEGLASLGIAAVSASFARAFYFSYAPRALNSRV